MSFEKPRNERLSEPSVFLFLLLFLAVILPFERRERVRVRERERVRGGGGEVPCRPETTNHKRLSAAAMWQRPFSPLAPSILRCWLRFPSPTPLDPMAGG